MALSDLKVYSEFAYTTFTEVLRQQVNLFNQASAGAIVLGVGAHLGDFSDSVFWKKVDGLVRRRNAYGSGSVAAKNLAQETETMVKVAAGTPPINIDPGQFRWIQQNPEIAGAVIGQQLAVEALADMLNTGLGAFYVSHLQTTDNVLDITGRTTPADKLSVAVLAEGSAKLGDQSGGSIQAWVMHSKPMFDIYANALANANQLFVYGNVIVSRDPLGKLLIMTDSPSLVNTTPTPDVYHTLGLKAGAIIVDRNNDFDANEETSNGDENIKRTYQAEWSFNLGIAGHAWDKANGGKSPTNAALLTGTNWDKIVTSNKDLGGVIIESH
jgi:hypothetical protein